MSENEIASVRFNEVLTEQIQESVAYAVGENGLDYYVFWTSGRRYVAVLADVYDEALATARERPNKLGDFGSLLPKPAPDA